MSDDCLGRMDDIQLPSHFKFNQGVRREAIPCGGGNASLGGVTCEPRRTLITPPVVKPAVPTEVTTGAVQSMTNDLRPQYHDPTCTCSILTIHSHFTPRRVAYGPLASTYPSALFHGSTTLRNVIGSHDTIAEHIALGSRGPRAMAHDSQTSINIPQLLAVAVVGFLAIRWFMSKPSNGGTTSSSPNASRRAQAIDPAKIERIASVFPQLDRRTIAWDLQRNGGNVEATSERILSGRGLETPPPSYQPNIPTPAAIAGQSGASAADRKSPTAQPDLITRYNLQSKVSGKGKEAVPSEEQKKNAWSADKNLRADALRKRREEMILAARRKMQQNDAVA